MLALAVLYAHMCVSVFRLRAAFERTTCVVVPKGKEHPAPLNANILATLEPCRLRRVWGVALPLRDTPSWLLRCALPLAYGYGLRKRAE